MSLTLKLYINELPDNAICSIAIYADDTTIFSKCEQASDLQQQLELASQLESDLETLLAGARSGLLISIWEKVNLFRLTNVITLVLFKWKLMGLFLKKNHLLRRWGCFFLLNWIGAYIISIAKTNSKKIGANWLGQEIGAY